MNLSVFLRRQKRVACKSLIALLLVCAVACKHASSTSTGSTDAEDSSDDATEATTATATQTSAVEDAESPRIIPVASDTLTLTINGVTSGQTLYLAKINASKSEISAKNVRYVRKGSGISLNTASSSTPSTPSLPSNGHSGYTPPRAAAPADAGEASSSAVAWHCYVPESDLALTQADETASRAAISNETLSTTLALGTQKSLYIDHGYSSSLTKFTEDEATLRAIGSSCYVWVIDDYYSESASGKYVSDDVAAQIAAQFDSIYPLVRTVFGQESDAMLDFRGEPKYPMASMSPTGTMVNIVLYDIAADYSEKSTSTTGIAGYFYSKDYYYAVSDITNRGKYFYIDSAYANENANDIYSTLAHEFQHMINFGVKNIAQGLESGTAYNEMLSMLCEDMLSAYFADALTGFTNDATPINRLPYFNKLYYLSGLEYRADSTAYTLCSYATNYAFGAWLLRNYGGIPLLAALSQNASVDIASIENAVNSENGTALTITDLLAGFAAACLVKKSDYGFNRAVLAESTQNDYCYKSEKLSYEYPLQAIDLWNLAAMLPEAYEEYKRATSYYKFDGAQLFASNQYNALRPYGMMLHKLGTATASTVTLTFSSSGASALSMYVVIE